VFVGFGRAVVAAVFAVGLLIARRERPPEARHWWPLVRTALSVVIGFPVLSALALTSVPASHAQIFIGLSPIATALVAARKASERPSRAFWFAAIAGALSVGVFGWLHAGSGFGRADALLLLAVALVGFGYAEGAQLARELGGLRVVSWALIVALPITIPVTLWASLSSDFREVSLGAWSGFAYVSLVSMFLAFVAWYHGLSRGNIAQLSQVQLAMPVLGVGWAALLLGEALEALTLLSGVAVVACSLLAQRRRTRAQ
jgi:drug/metabolite transporter (DMT)-like permease